jgi:hypothetical protein
MLGNIRYITSSFSITDSLCFVYRLCSAQNGVKYLLPGSSLHRRICPNSKEFEKNLLPYAAADFLWAYAAIIMKAY